jgi:hypothetical protein
MDLEHLKFMKAMAAERGEWKEVERINKMINFNMMTLQKRKAIKGRRAK